ncbi:MAG: hypothetical protein ABIP16_00160 [Thermomonas sp.]
MKLRFLANLVFLLAITSAPLLAFAGDKPDGQPAASENPPPKMPLASFQRFEMEPVAMGAPFAGQKGNEAAKQKLQANLDLRATPLLAQWNVKPAGDAPRTLKIQPSIRYIRFITGGKRFFGGAFAGGSSVLVNVNMVDAATGEVIASPEFYQHANAFGAAYSFGGTDKTMLIRISNMATEYLRSNYSNAVGGSVSVAPAVEGDGTGKE